MNHFRLALALLLSIGAILPLSGQGHFFWAETDEDADSVAVIFSENAGVPDKVISMMEDRVTTIAYTSAGHTVNVALGLNHDKNLLEGDLPRKSNDMGPALVSGYLDFGPFMKFADLEYSFGAQVYHSEDDFQFFFQPLLTGDKPSIALRNCGATKDGSMSYQFDIGGFPSEGPLGVCLYRKGGQKIGCGEWNQKMPEEELVVYGVPAESSSLGRSLARDRSQFRNPSVDATPEISKLQPMEDAEGPYILYAIANKTITDEASGDVSIAFASTSVYFEGPCK